MCGLRRVWASARGEWRAFRPPSCTLNGGSTAPTPHTMLLAATWGSVASWSCCPRRFLGLGLLCDVNHCLGDPELLVSLVQTFVKVCLVQFALGRVRGSPLRRPQRRRSIERLHKRSAFQPTGTDPWQSLQITGDDILVPVPRQRSSVCRLRSERVMRQKRCSRRSASHIALRKPVPEFVAGGDSAVESDSAGHDPHEEPSSLTLVSVWSAPHRGTASWGQSCPRALFLECRGVGSTAITWNTTRVFHLLVRHICGGQNAGSSDPWSWPGC